MTFDPRPIDTAGVVLDATEEGLVERLAINAHRSWARTRIAEGWTYGPERNVGLRVTNLLVPYEQLSDAEQELNRRLVRQTLLAAKAEGWALTPAPPEPLSSEERERLNHLEALLEREAKREPRINDFDMDDEVELAEGNACGVDTLNWALRTYAEVLQPAWDARNTEAIRLARRHQFVARVAIISGTLALVSAILQFVFGGMLAGWMEKIAISAAAVAVIAGLRMKLHHGWLSARQAAERLRNYKFASLADPRLWSDREAWRRDLEAQVQILSALDGEAAAEWARNAHHAGPGVEAKEDSEKGPGKPPHMSAYDLHALSRYYKVKRHGHQRTFFNDRLEELSRATWPLRLHLPVWLFFGSVGCVGLHLLIHQAVPHAQTEHGLLYVLERITLAGVVILPILGFGLRAWLAAFETPRRAMLFEAKRNAVDTATAALEKADLTPGGLLEAIRESEQLFETEHREWCRLEFAAEWFL